MEINTAMMKRCVLLNISGRIDGSTAPKLQESLNEVMTEGSYRIVLDLKKVDFVSSAGLWVLVNAQKKCKRFNRGELVLADVPQRIYDALDLAGFIPYFRTFEDSTKAVGSF